MEKCRVLVKWGKKVVGNCMHNIMLFLKNCLWVRKETILRLYITILGRLHLNYYMNEFDFHLWLVFIFFNEVLLWKVRKWIKTCMVSSRGWHGSLSSTIYCSRSPGLLHLLCKPSFISCPGHLELYQSYPGSQIRAPGPLSLHCPHFSAAI